MWYNKFFFVGIALAIVSGISSSAFGDDLSKKVSLEERRLLQVLEKQKKSCEENISNTKYVQRSKCIDEAKMDHKKRMSSLANDPELYFYNKEDRDLRSAIRGAAKD